MLPPNKRAALAKKISALLAKTVASGCTEAEALNAAMLAAQLQAEYQINLTEAELLAEGFFQTEIPWVSNKIEFISDRLAVPVANFTSTCVWVIRPTPQDRKQFKINKSVFYKTVFCGLHTDTLFAKWLLEFLCEFVENQGRFHAALDGTAHGFSSIYKNFVMGACTRLNERLQNIKQESTVQSADRTALIVLDKRLIVNDYVDQLNLNFTKGAEFENRVTDEAAFEAGREAAERAGLNRPVNSGGTVKAIE
jgi:hypothetical protein